MVLPGLSARGSILPVLWAGSVDLPKRPKAKTGAKPGKRRSIIAPKIAQEITLYVRLPMRLWVVIAMKPRSRGAAQIYAGRCRRTVPMTSLPFGTTKNAAPCSVRSVF